MTLLDVRSELKNVGTTVLLPYLAVALPLAAIAVLGGLYANGLARWIDLVAVAAAILAVVAAGIGLSDLLWPMVIAFSASFIDLWIEARWQLPLSVSIPLLVLAAAATTVPSALVWLIKARHHTYTSPDRAIRHRLGDI